jgi:hypothetical protein
LLNLNLVVVGVDIYTVIYDERIKCEPTKERQARKFRAERAREGYIQPTNCDAGIKIQMTCV